MSMAEQKQIIILGAGLTGLNLARKLEAVGNPVTILEARERLGGRIFTKSSANNTKIEMGATWLGPQHTHLVALLRELDIQVFEQYMEGITYFQPFGTSPPQAVELPPQSPNYRIASGTTTIIEKLAGKLNHSTIHLNQPIKQLDFSGQSVRVHTLDQTYEGDLVVSALSPALLVNSIRFSPSLPAQVEEVMRQTQTWMRDSIKAGVVFERPFWREKKLSGTLFSNVGPLNESYDHTSFDESGFAMKGFVNEAFATLPTEEREERVKNQLAEVFGSEASVPLAYEEMVWSQEAFTKGADGADLFPHQNNGHEVYQKSFFDDRFFIAGSETSPHFGGYMEGAIYSSNMVAEKLKAGHLTGSG